MTPQSHFMVMAPVAACRVGALRTLLDSMNAAPGLAAPLNAVLPFARFARLHFARLVILDDPTLEDVSAYGLEKPSVPTYLALLADCDGSARELLAEMAHEAATGLREIFAHCDGFEPGSDVLEWMLAHDTTAAATYVNRRGRTVLQILEENALQRALSARVTRDQPASPAEAQRVRSELRAFVAGERKAGRLELTPPQPTPSEWTTANLLHAFAIPIAIFLLSPVLIVLLPVILIVLRVHETRDPEICPRPADSLLHDLQVLEDHDVSNQYTALGSVKPGAFRRTLLSVLLVLIDYACRHVFTRGHLARVQTIHFARWVFIDDKQRVVFVSNYDGGHQAYMDDFINKVAWGLNLVFSNGIGWPRTRWLIKGGARIEQRFKYFQRRHQLPTQVWYKAYPGLALVDLERNQRIREGLERTSMSDAEAAAWLRLL